MNVWGTGLGTGSHSAHLYWVQLPLVTFTTARVHDGFRIQRFEAHPMHQPLLLEITVPDDQADLEYIQDLMVWEWPLAPNTPSYNKSYGLLNQNITLYQSGMYSPDAIGSGQQGINLNIFEGT